jgi:hypothetical protein
MPSISKPATVCSTTSPGRRLAALNGHEVFSYLRFGQNELEFTNENSERETGAAGGR